MQLMIDTSLNTLADLRSAANLIETSILNRVAAGGHTQEEVSLLPARCKAPDFEPAAPVAPVAVQDAPAAPITLTAAVPSVVTPAGEELPPAAAVFGAGGAIPLPPSVVPAIPAASTTDAPVAPTAPAAASPVELDKNGLPWDARIHASTKAKNADNSWRTRRNLDKATLDSVTAELKAGASVAPAVPTPPAMVIPPPPVVAPAAAPVNAAPVIPAPPVILPAPPAPGVAAPVLPANGTQPVAAVGAHTFATVMGKITAAMNMQKLTRPQVDEALTQNGVPNLAALAPAAPATLAAVDSYLSRWGI